MKFRSFIVTVDPIMLRYENTGMSFPGEQRVSEQGVTGN